MSDDELAWFAGSIELFAVTPPVLTQELGSTEQRIVAETDRRFAEQNAVWDARFDDLKSDADRRFAEQNATWDTRFSNLKSDMVRQFAHQQASALEQYNDLKKEIRAVGARQFVMMWGLVAIVVGAGVSDDVKQLFS